MMRGKPRAFIIFHRTSHRHGEAHAKIVVLAAAALESTWIPPHSRSRRSPNGVGNSSGVLGHYI